MKIKINLELMFITFNHLNGFNLIQSIDIVMHLGYLKIIYMF